MYLSNVENKTTAIKQQLMQIMLQPLSKNKPTIYIHRWCNKETSKNEKTIDVRHRCSQPMSKIKQQFVIDVTKQYQKKDSS